MNTDDYLQLSPALLSQAMEAAAAIPSPLASSQPRPEADGQDVDYLLRLRSVHGHPVPVEARLKRLVKALKRAYGFTLEEFNEAPQGNEAEK